MTERNSPFRRLPLWSGIATLSVALIAAALWAQSPRDVTIRPAQAAAALPVDRGAAALVQTLRKLHTRASLLMVTAHPDDEDGGVLVYMSRGMGARVALLTLNRGEGGANVMSSDYWDALGLVRTEELLAAGRYYGVQQYFTRVTDYGFSKTKEEALQKWGHDQVLYDVVRVVRMVRPLVITSVFIGGPTDGHGNHQVAGQMAQEAFNAAADPNKFPDQIQAGLRPWAPLKDYARVPRYLEAGNLSPQGVYDYASHKWAPAGYQDYVNNKWVAGPMSVTLRVPAGTFDPVLGLNYEQVSRLGLGFQKSQNGGTGLPEAGAIESAYHRFGSRVPAADGETSMFDGIDTSLMGIADLAHGKSGFLRPALMRINTQVETAIREFSASDPARIAPVLADGLKATNRLVDQVQASNLSDDTKYDVLHELAVKQAQFNTALVEALQLSMQAAVTTPRPNNGNAAIIQERALFMGSQPTFQVAIPGQRFWVDVHVVAQGATPVQLDKVSLAAANGENWNPQPDDAADPVAGPLGPNQPKDVRLHVTVPESAVFTRPYFSRPTIEQANYTIDDPRYLNDPLAPYPLTAWVDLTYDGVVLHMSEVVQTVSRVTGPGLVLQPLIVAPAISVSISPIAGVVPLEAKAFQVTASIHSNVKGPAQGTVRLELPSGWSADPTAAPFATSRDGQEQSVSFDVTPSGLQAQPYTITAIAEYDGREYREGYHAVGYPGLRSYNLYRPATYKTTGVNVKVAPNLNVGYIMGSGDDVPQSLENLGIKVHFLTAEDLASGDLSKYDVILLGVRTYAVRDDLRTYNNRLLDYVKNGGVVIVQYNTPEFDHNFGPYPYSMTNDPEEVTDETSPMVILDPQNPLFTWPNQITAQDFDGWIEERGSKFMRSWDDHYEPLLETHDPGQDPQKGGLLYARYGKGVYIYNAYAFYRELPEGVPGAYRLMANMLSLPRNPQVFPASAGDR